MSYKNNVSDEHAIKLTSRIRFGSKSNRFLTEVPFRRENDKMPNDVASKSRFGPRSWRDRCGIARTGSKDRTTEVGSADVRGCYPPMRGILNFL